MKTNAKFDFCSRCGFAFRITPEGTGRCPRCFSTFSREGLAKPEFFSLETRINLSPVSRFSKTAMREGHPSQLGEYGDDWEEFVEKTSPESLEQWAYCPNCKEKFRTHFREVLFKTSCPKCDRVLTVHLQNPEALRASSPAEN